MRLFIKLTAIILLAGIIIFSAIVLFVNPNDYKNEIIQQVNKKTGHQLTIEGDIGLSVFPWLALELSQTSLSNAPGFTSDYFAQAKQIQVRVKLLPLLSGNMEIDTVILDGLALHLEKNQRGDNNWSQFSSSTTAPSTSNEKSSQQPITLPDINIAGITVYDANINWSDQSTGEQYAVQQFNLSVSRLAHNTPSDIELDFFFIADGTQTIHSHVQLNTSLNIDFIDQFLAFNQLSLAVRTEGKDIPSTALQVTSNIDLHLANQTMAMKETRIQLNELTIEKQLLIEQLFSSAPKLSGTLSILPINLRQLATHLGQTLPPMQDTDALTQFSLETHLSGSTHQLTFDKLATKLDDTTLTGTLTISPSRTALLFDLILDEINLDRYLPPVDKEAEATTTVSQAETEKTIINTSSLEALNLDGKIAINTLSVHNIKVDQIEATIKADKGKINLYPLKATLYQGSYDGNIQLIAQDNALQFRVNEKLHNIQAKPLLNALLNDDTISGKMNTHLALHSRGTTIEQLKHGLNGQGSFAFTDGAINGFNLAETIRQAKSMISSKTNKKSTTPLKTDFSSLTGSFTAKSGVLNNPDLVLKSPLLRVNGKGNASLKSEQLDYHLDVSVVASSKGQLGKDLADLKGMTIPVTITGNFQQPDLDVNLMDLIQRNATLRAKDPTKLIGDALNAKPNKDNPIQQLKGLF